MSPSAKLQDRAFQVSQRLKKANPTPHVELAFENPWQLLVATILSAQSTDKRVNVVMKDLLQRWSTPQKLAQASQEEVEEVIRSTGFFRNKAKSIRGASQMLLEKFQGQVPSHMSALLELPGVARKTANVILGAAFGISSGITVDTHVIRVSQRLGFTRHTQPEKIEEALCALFPDEEWISISHRLVLHGRYVCLAKKPKCETCPLNELCPSQKGDPENSWERRASQVALEMASRAQGFHVVGQVRPSY